MNDNNIEKWVTLKESQAYLGVGRETILQWIAKRNMPAYKMGRLWKFKISEVELLVLHHPTKVYSPVCIGSVDVIVILFVVPV